MSPLLERASAFSGKTFFSNPGGLSSPTAASRDIRVTMDVLSRSSARSRFRRFAGTRTLQGFRGHPVSEEPLFVKGFAAP